ncbi:MAG: elongation factor G [Ruminococcaceae bacterium]|nr:elongation factor G [Oscillospiraceae bacterium]
MASFDMKRIRNLVLMGHSGSGKTSLAEAMLYLAGGSDRLGKVPDGNTAFDFDPESIRRKISIASSQAPLVWKDTKINVIDTPGYPGFTGEVSQAVRVADSAIIVVDAKAGIEVGTELAWDKASDAGLPKAIFINKFDDNDARFAKILNGLNDQFGRSICPITIPMVSDGEVKGSIDLIQMEAHSFDEKGTHHVLPIPEENMDAVEEFREMLLEAVAGTSEDLMNKYFGGEEITHMEIYNAVHEGIIHGDIVPCFSGCATKLWGVWTLLNFIAQSFPRHSAKGSEISADGDDIEINPDGAPAILIYKTIADPFVGKMSFFKVMNGTVKGDLTLKNARTGDSEKLGKIYSVKGKTQTEVPELLCGDIGMVSKLSSAATGDTLSWTGDVSYAACEYPQPFYIKSLSPKAKGDEDKISSAVTKLLEEDMTLKYEVNRETSQMLLSGLGGTHLDITLAKMKARYGVEVVLGEKKIAYRETIRKSCKVEGKHKKQSGGHGQYGHVKIEFSPGEGEGLTFTESIFGGSVPKNFHPAVEKGLQECMSKGVLAGYPVVGLAANLYDGSYHDVDSSEMAFKTAAGIAFRDGLPQCSPVLLEPVGKLKVFTPDSQMGDVIGDLNKRRGRIMGMEQDENKRGWSIIEAEVPEAEMNDYVHALRAISQGRASFTFFFDHYEEVPAAVAEKVIAAAKTE